MHIVKPYEKRSYLLRKRRRGTDSTSDDNSQNDNQSSEKIDTPTKNARKENETLTENVMKDVLNTTNNDTEKCQYFNNSYIKNEEDPTVMEHNNIDNEIMSDSQKSLISVRKIEDLCKTPQKNNVSNNLENIENIKEESINSPDISSPFISTINSLEWNPQSIKSLLETPMAFKKEMHDVDNNTPNRQRKRKLSLDVSDIDQMPDPLKLELPDMEAIDMLHDLNSIIDFEEIKIPPDILTSTVNNTMHNEYDVEISKDPLTDPLYIASNDEHDLTDENVNHKNKRKLIRKTRSTSRQIEEKQSSAQHNTKSTEESKVDTDYLKDILGELDIDLESETENEERKPESDIEILYDLKIKIIHDVPKQHNIEHTSGTRPLTKSERQLFLEYGPLKSGAFSPKEDKIILNNWKTFCEIHNWDPKYTEPFIYMKYGTKFYMRTTEQRRKFVQFLGNGLPWRSLYSIYRRFRYLHEDHTKSFTRYTLYEDKQILSHLKKKNKKKRPNAKFTELAKMLGRSTHSIRLRYELLKKRGHTEEKPLSEVTWTLPLVGKFIKTLMDVTLCDNVAELKDASIPKVVWLKLEVKLNIDHDVLRLFWIYQLHMQLFCPEPIYLNDIKIKLIEHIYGKGIEHIREIIWPKVAKFFDGITTIFLCKTFCNLVSEGGTKLRTSNLSKIIKYLYVEKIPQIQNERSDKILPRLLYGNGKVQIIDEDPLNE